MDIFGAVPWDGGNARSSKTLTGLTDEGASTSQEMCDAALREALQQSLGSRLVHPSLAGCGGQKPRGKGPAGHGRTRLAVLRILVNGLSIYFSSRKTGLAGTLRVNSELRTEGAPPWERQKPPTRFLVDCLSGTLIPV